MKKRDKITFAVLIGIIVIEAVIIFSLLPKYREGPLIRAVPPDKGKIAIVIDDWGYRHDTLAIVRQIKYPLTMSVLPNLTYSRQVAQRLHEMGFEIILHLPMEPREKSHLEKNSLLISMDESQIRQIIDKDLAGLVNARGVSNHMGSLFTANRGGMAIVLSDLKKRQLYFLDSVVIPNSVCPGLAKETGIKFARRDVFLDNKENPLYIRGQVDKLKNIARQYGRAIAIGHDRKITLEVLKEVMPELAKEGYKFVFVSDLVR